MLRLLAAGSVVQSTMSSGPGQPEVLLPPNTFGAPFIGVIIAALSVNPVVYAVKANLDADCHRNTDGAVSSA
jgi:hypothetical protein